MNTVKVIYFLYSFATSVYLKKKKKNKTSYYYIGRYDVKLIAAQIECISGYINVYLEAILVTELVHKNPNEKIYCFLN